MTKRIAILGSTGSVGTQTLDVVEKHPDQFDLVGMTAHCSQKQLQRQAERWSPDLVGLTDSSVTSPDGWLSGPQALTEIASQDLDMLVLSVVGSVGLGPCLTALENGTDVALANKEVMVIGGDLVKRKEAESDGRLIPVDSEHSAIFQALQGERHQAIKQVVITASGGPFKDYSRSELKDVSREQALDHPNWDMGPKITVDSATMMNKGLEVIEACYLFDLQPDQISALVHPQSVVHGFVEFEDRSIMAQCSKPDMRLPIQYALFYPERRPSLLDSIDLTESFSWEFEPVDETRFPAFGLACDALNDGGTAPAALNAANEIAVGFFLDGDLDFMEISSLIERCMNDHTPVARPDREQLLEVDRWARTRTREIANKEVSLT